MEIREFYARLLNQNIIIALDGEELDIKAPKGVLTKELINEIKSNKEALVDYLKTNTNVKASIPIIPLQPYYHLSSAQKRLYLLQQMDLNSVAYNMPSIMTVEGDLDKGRLDRIIEQLIQRHESFRTSFELEDGEPIQRIHGKLPFHITCHEIYDKQVDAILNEFVKPFDLSVAPLLRVSLVKTGDKQHMLLFDMHHIISDGVSMGIFVSEFVRLYGGDELPKVSIQYKDYAAWQQKLTSSERLKNQESYWLGVFSGELPVLNLPYDFARPAVQNFEGDEISFRLEKDSTGKFRELLKESDSTLYMGLLAIYNILMSRYSGQEDVIIGSPSAGRLHADLGNVIGMFVNTLAMRNKPEGEKRFTEFLREVKQTTIKAFENQDYQFDELVDKVVHTRDMGRNPLFSVMFVLQNMEVEELEIKGLVFRPYKTDHTISKFDVTLTASEANDEIHFAIEYSTKLFKRETIDRMVVHFNKIIETVITDPQIRLKDIDIIGDAERQKALYEFNNTEAAYPQKRVVHQLFEEQVVRTPDSVALVLGDIQLTYKCLDEKSNNLAFVLRDHGVKPDNLVGLLMDRSIETIIGMLAIIKAGGAYLPIDIDYPEERIEYVIKDSGTKILIVNKDFNRTLSNDISLIFTEDLESVSNKRGGGLENINQPSDLCYVIYTSGTTGNPKGVMVEHRNVVRLFFNDKFQFDFGAKDVWTMFHSHCFDFSVWEIYGALLYGGKLIIIPKIIAKDTRTYLEILKEQSVTILNQTPSAFYNLINEELTNTTAELSVRYIIFGGEALTPRKLKAWREKYPNIKLINMFGITETTVHVTYKEIGEYEIENNISNIGKPIPTLSVYIFDAYQKLIPAGVIGELYVGGDGVSRGYLGKEELTNKRFIPNPYNPSERLYRSGDLARVVSGEIEYIGRMDNQVQLRGFRIELGEIENQLYAHDKIKEVVVLAKQKGEDSYLVAYYVSDKEIESIDLRGYLLEKLPDYMVPSYYVHLESLPLTSNGKLDRKALPEPVAKDGDGYEAPRNELERKLAEIWSQVLDFPNVGINHNYFAIGGDSIKAIRLINAINKEIQSNLRISDLFENQTVASMCYRINNSIDSKKELKLLEEINGEFEEIKRTTLANIALDDQNDIEDIFPMSDIQKGMIFHSIIQPGIYHDQMVSIANYVDFDTELLNKAVTFMVEKHLILRTSFHQHYDVPLQFVHKSIEPQVFHFDLSNKRPNQQVEIIKNYLHDDKEKPFVLNRPGLWRFFTFKLDRDNYCVCFICHHAIIDGWSDASFKTELNNIYITLKKDSDFVPKQLKSSYKDYVIEQTLSANKPEIINYWKNELLDYKRYTFASKEIISRSESEADKLSGELHAKLGTIAKQHNVSVKNICFSAFLYALNMFSYDNDITVGLITNNRPVKEDGDKILGCFLNTIPFRLKMPDSLTWKALITLVNERINHLKKYENISLAKIVEVIGESTNSGNPITDIIFNYVDFHIYDKLESYNKDVITEFFKNEGEENLFADLGGVQDNSLFAFNISETGGELWYSLSYQTSFLSKDCAKDFMGFFERIISQIINDSTKIIKREDLFTKDQLSQILYAFNNTKVDFPKEKVIHQLFEEQVNKTPDSIALVFGAESLTYQELNRRSNQLARHLIENGVLEENYVGVFYEPSFSVYIGILSILKTGKAYLPIDTALPESRIQFMVKDSGAKILLTSDSTRAESGNRHVISLDKQEIYENDSANLDLSVPPSSPVYLIYTSGSTGLPKGVVVNNKSLVNLCFYHNDFHKISFEDHLSKYAGFGFDASVWEIFPGLVAGASLHIIDDSIKLDPSEINEYFNKNDITVSFLPTQFCERFMQYDNKSLRILLTGGDKLTNFNKRGYRLFNNYGPTENTVVTTNYEVKDFVNNIPIGKPLANTGVYILGKSDSLQPIGVPGELCISGEGVAVGYLNNPELTAEKFIDHPYEAGARLYRTGDLARWLPDGCIEFLGRIDHQVKIRGFRIEVGEVENALLKYENVQECVVIDRDNQGDRYLCAYIVGRGIVDQEKLRDYLHTSLPDYMIPSYFVLLDKLPLNINGKVDRKSLPSPEVKAGDDYVAASSATEAKLVGIWSDVLSIPEKEISVTANFFSLGGHSLKATVLTGKIHKALGVEFPLREVFIHTTIRAQASRIGDMDKKTFVSIPKAKIKDHYPLSSAQSRIYLLQQMDVDSVAYNMPYTIALGKGIDKDRVEAVFLALIRRHESLRTSFDIIDEMPAQRIHEAVEFRVETKKITASEILTFKQDFIRPFDLSQAPLLRVALVEELDGDTQLIVDMHHIISDGVSQSILENEFQLLYTGVALSPLNIQFKDYSEWQNSEWYQLKVKEQEEYWLRHFEGELPILNLPADYTRPLVQSYEGSNVSFTLSKDETTRIKLFAERNGLTLYMSILASFNILLSKLSGQEDIVIGTPIAGRNHDDLAGVVGMFVNTLAIRNRLEDNASLKGFVESVKRITVESFENQEYPFESLVEKISVNRDVSRNPLFDAMFNLLNQNSYSGDLSELEDQCLIHTKGISKFDLSLTAVDYGEQLLLNFEYCSKLFKAETIERYIGYFKQIVNQVAVAADIPLSEIEIISVEEKHQLLYEFNNTISNYPKNKTIHQLFEEQVERTPDRIAIAFEGLQISYSELNRRANQVSRYLTRKGIKPDDRIGLAFDRSEMMIIGIFGVLKAGGCYVPIDINYPELRIKYILDKSNSKLILLQKLHHDKLDTELPKVVFEDIELNIEDVENPDLKVKPTNLSYVIYTSGSTGDPKGVQVEHASVVNLLYFLQDKYPVHMDSSYLLKTSYCFDVSISELFGWILGGGKLLILEQGQEKDPVKIIEFIPTYRVTHVNFVPTVFKLFTQSLLSLEQKRLKTLEYVMIAGEALLREHLIGFVEHNPTVQIENLYGPTEATVYASHYTVSEQDGPILIGKPISNYNLYVLGKTNSIQPIGVSGELCIGGEGLARGYLNNPDLTAERFIAHPFAEGERLYRTGDLARWLPDGNIEFLGRMDHQVKIRGFRIELGEVESALLRHGRVKECIVIPREDQGDKYLCAYSVCDGKVDGEALRTHLSSSLPDYMIPSYYVTLERLPLTSNGKVDRKALPAPEHRAGSGHVAPSSPTERQLVGIWSAVLSIPSEAISVTDSFFAIGGHSLRATACVNRIKKEMNLNLPLIEIFKRPTVAQLSAYLDAHRLVTPADDEHLVLLKAGSPSGKNLFLIHDGSGEVEGYVELCRQTDDGNSYWGVKAGGLKTVEPSNMTVEWLAEYYLNCIRLVQPSGDYNILGWSLGGTIAFEMVRQLERAGAWVGLLCLVDSAAPRENPGTVTERFTVESELRWLERYLSKETISRLSAEANLKSLWSDIVTHLNTFAADDQVIRNEIANSIAFDIHGVEEMPIEELIRQMNFTRSLINACDRYLPADPIRTPIQHFAASESSHPINGWEKFTEKELIVKVIQGDHFSILKSPNVVALYNEFELCLRSINRKELIGAE